MRVSLDMYPRISPFSLSLLPRSYGEYGCAKRTNSLITIVDASWRACQDPRWIAVV